MLAVSWVISLKSNAPTRVELTPIDRCRHCCPFWPPAQRQKGEDRQAQEAVEMTPKKKTNRLWAWRNEKRESQDELENEVTWC